MTTIPDTDLPEFSLVRGGPVYRLLIRTGLLKLDLALIPRAAAAFAAITWLPLLLLALLDGTAVSGATVPFLSDFSAHVRFLFALPLLIIADALIDQRLKQTVRQFVRSGLVSGKDLAYFHSTIRTANRLTSSSLIESLLLLLAFTAIVTGTEMDIAGSLADWRAAGNLQLAGWWYIAVSLPLYRFILFRWIWRLAVWFWFLWRTAKQDLQLNPTHPDHAGGLGFLSIGQMYFGIIIFAFASVVSAALGKRIMYGEADLFSFTSLIVVFVLLSMVLLLAPLIVFSPMLLRTRRNGLFEYSVFADRYTDAFARKWIKGERREGDALGSSDIQSLADLANSFQIIQRMKLFPFSRETVIILALSAVVPMVPLLLTAFPADELLKRIIKILL